MIDKYVGFAITVIIIAIVLWVASLYLPFYGFMQKRFKGACLGCILQPFISAIILALSFVVIFTYMTSDMIKYRKNAMVMVKKAPKDSTNVATHLYIGADDVCFLESGNLEVTIRLSSTMTAISPSTTSFMSTHRRYPSTTSIW